jgi:hypothetical protein
LSLITIDTTELRQLANRIGEVGKTFDRLQVMAINRVATRSCTAAKREIVAQVSLKSSYVLDRLSLSKANGNNPVAIIASTKRGVSLSNYPYRQLTQAAKRAKGDAMRGIGAWRKQAGISVGVKAGGGRKTMRGAFLVPRRAGTESGGNGMGIFIRTGSGRKDIKHLYAPSVSQVFTSVIQAISPEVAEDFQDELNRLINVEIKKALK